MSIHSSLLNITIKEYLASTEGQKLLKDILTQTLTVTACESQDEESTKCRCCGSENDGLDQELIESVLIPVILRGVKKSRF